MRKLILCSGRQRRKGWTTLDANPAYAPDIVATIPPLPDEVSKTTWHEIELIHGIEHFYLWEAVPLLEELHAALEPGGRLTLEQPNIEYAAKILAGELNPPKGKSVSQFAMWPLYGDPSHKNKGYCHHWGWTPKTLSCALRAVGFTDITEHKAQHHYPIRDFRLEARRDPCQNTISSCTADQRASNRATS